MCGYIYIYIYSGPSRPREIWTNDQSGRMDGNGIFEFEYYARKGEEAFLRRVFQARLKASLLDERSWERAERERANCATQRRENFLTMEDVEKEEEV